MPQLSPEGRRAVEDVARRMGFSPDAVTSMLFSIMAGRGGIAISDMFNNVLKARVGALCNELSALVRVRCRTAFFIGAIGERLTPYWAA
jgi:DNA-binding LacI/PurR family transcriptional regulator